MPKYSQQPTDFYALTKWSPYKVEWVSLGLFHPKSVDLSITYNPTCKLVTLGPTYDVTGRWILSKLWWNKIRNKIALLDKETPLKYGNKKAI